MANKFGSDILIQPPDPQAYWNKTSAAFQVFDRSSHDFDTSFPHVQAPPAHQNFGRQLREYGRFRKAGVAGIVRAGKFLECLFQLAEIGQREPRGDVWMTRHELALQIVGCRSEQGEAERPEADRESFHPLEVGAAEGPQVPG